MSSVKIDQRIWVQPSSQRQNRNLTLLVRHTDELRLGDPLVFDCDIVTNDIEILQLILTVNDAAGATLYEDRIRREVKPGSNPCRFEWLPAALPDGLHEARVALRRAISEPICEWVFGVYVYTAPNLEAKINLAEQKAQELDTHLGRLSAQGIPPYAAMTLQIAKHALPVARERFAEGRWPQADALAAFLLKSLDAQRSLLTFSELHAAPARPFDATKITIRDAGYAIGDEPIFLVGAQIDGSTRPLEAMVELGLNAVRGGSQSQESLSAAARNLALFLDLAPIGAELGDSSLPHGRTLIGPNGFHEAGALNRALPQTVNQDNLIGISAAARPLLYMPVADLQDSFIEWALKFYGGVEPIKYAWHMQIYEPRDILAHWQNDRNAFQYDLQTFMQDLAGQALEAEFRKASVLAHDKPLIVDIDDRIFLPGSAREGIDYTRVARAAEATGLLLEIADGSAATRGIGLSAPYAIDYPRPFATIAVAKAMAPDQPVVCSNLTLRTSTAPYAKLRREFAHSAVWEAAMHGADAVIASADLFTQPELLEGYASAALDLSRLATVVHAFQEKNAEVAVLWSPASAIYDGGDPYLTSALNAFEGCSAFGRKVRFITEEDCANRSFEGIEVLVIPKTPAVQEETFQAIAEYVRSNGYLVRAENTIPYTPRGLSRISVLPHDQRTILVRGGDGPENYLAAMDSAEEQGFLKPIPRAAKRFGYALHGVRTEHLVHEGAQYLYLVNLTQEPIHGELTGDLNAGTDLIHGGPVEFPRTLEPLEPMLVLLTPPAPSADAQPIQASAVVGSP